MIGFELICKVKNVDYKEIAEMFDFRVQNVCAWVSETRAIPKKYLGAIAKKLNVSEEILTLKLGEGTISWLENGIIERDKIKF